MTEAKLRTKIKKQLAAQFGGWWVVIHGGPFQERFIPDLIGVCQGKFFGLEVKLPLKVHTLTPGQAHRIRKICTHGGYARMVSSVAESVEFVATSLQS